MSAAVDLAVPRRPRSRRAWALPAVALRAARFARHVRLLLRRAVADAWQDRVLGLCAEAAFWQMLSLPSLFLALIASLGAVSRWCSCRAVSSSWA